MNATDKLDLQVSESSDGSAMVSVADTGFPNLSNNTSNDQSDAP
jgi:hypothetical protein